MSGRRAQTTLQPSVLRWARERAGFGMERVAAKVGGQTRSGRGVGTVREDQHVSGGQAGALHSHPGRLPLLA